jgi:hypothetical protein
MSPRFTPSSPAFSRLRLALLTVALGACFCSAASAVAAAEEAEVKLVRVWTEYRAADSFVRLAEYFGGREKAPELITRSQPDSRDGYYFLTRFKSPEALPGSILALEYFMPGDEEARVQFFPVDLTRGSRAVLAGLTGADWPSRKTLPTAWRLRLLGPDGAELAMRQSFLWSLPPAEAAAEVAAESSAPSADVPAPAAPAAPLERPPAS